LPGCIADEILGDQLGLSTWAEHPIWQVFDSSGGWQLTPGGVVEPL